MPIPSLNRVHYVDARVGITQVENRVTLWEDQDFLGNYAVDDAWATGSYGPAMNVDTINEVPCPYFDGGLALFRTGAFDELRPAIPGAITEYLVFKFTNPSQVFGYVSDGGNLNTAAVYINGAEIVIRRGSSTVGIFMGADNVAVLAVSWRRGSNHFGYLNGSYFENTAQEFSGTTRFVLGGRGDGGLRGQFTLAMRAIYDEAHDEATMLSISQTLGEEWAVEAYLQDRTFTTAEPLLDASNNPVSGAKIVIMNLDRFEDIVLTEGVAEINQANLIVGVMETGVDGHASANFEGFTHLDSEARHIGFAYKDGETVIGYVPIIINPFEVPE